MKNRDKEDYKIDVVSIRLVRESPVLSTRKIINPEAAVDVLGKYMREFDRELICVVNLKSDCTPINCSFASVGTVCSSLASPKDIVKSTILSNAAGIIILHNHPSGSLSPSKEDIYVTKRIMDLAEILDVRFHDHVIVGAGNNSYFSFKENNIVPYRNSRKVFKVEELNFPQIAKEANNKQEPGENSEDLKNNRSKRR